MAHNTYIPRRKDWKTVINERIDLYKAVSRSGDTTKTDFILLHDHLAHEDHYRTITGGPWDQIEDAFEATEEWHKLHSIANGGIHTVASMYHDVHESMANLKASGEIRAEAWEKHLNDQINAKEKQTHEMWENIRKAGHDTIADMPKPNRDGAGSVFISAMGAVADFAAKAVNWLKGAVASVGSWLRNAWQKIVGFAKTVANGFVTAWHAVLNFFGGGGNNNFAILASEPAVHVPTDSGEGCRNRTSSDGRHVGDHSHPQAGGDGRHSGRATSE